MVMHVQSGNLPEELASQPLRQTNDSLNLLPQVLVIVCYATGVEDLVSQPLR
jgi:hypothetical protein